MSLSVHESSVGVMTRMLGRLSVLLEKAEAHATAQGIDPATLLAARLAPDMYPLTRQVQTASDNAKGCGARLAGVAIPSYPDDEASFAELQARIEKTVKFLQEIDPQALQGAEDRVIDLKAGRASLTLSGRDYLFRFALPNFFFHVATAYDILRSQGVPLGKFDYLGELQSAAS